MRDIIVVLFLTLVVSLSVMATGMLAGGKKTHNLSEIPTLLSTPADGEKGGKTIGEYLHDGLVRYNQAINTMFLLKVDKYLKYETQVVEGILYIITVDMGLTGCRKDLFFKEGREGQNELLENCKIDETIGSQKVEFKIQVRVWLEGEEKVKVSFETFRQE